MRLLWHVFPTRQSTMLAKERELVLETHQDFPNGGFRIEVRVEKQYRCLQ